MEDGVVLWDRDTRELDDPVRVPSTLSVARRVPTGVQVPKIELDVVDDAVPDGVFRTVRLGVELEDGLRVGGRLADADEVVDALRVLK